MGGPRNSLRVRRSRDRDVSCHAFPGSWIPQLVGSSFPSVVRSSGRGHFAHVGWSPCSHGVSFGSSLSFRLGEPLSSIPSVGSVSTFRWSRSKGGNGMEKGKRKGAVQVEYTLGVLFPSCSGIGPYSRSPRFLDSDWSSRGEGECVWGGRTRGIPLPSMNGAESPHRVPRPPSTSQRAVDRGRDRPRCVETRKRTEEGRSRTQTCGSKAKQEERQARKGNQRWAENEGETHRGLRRKERQGSTRGEVRRHGENERELACNRGHPRLGRSLPRPRRG